MREIILLLGFLFFPILGNAQQYEAEVQYPEGDGPFPIVILSHGAGGPSWAYQVFADEFLEQGFAAVVLDHYSQRGNYGVKFRNIPQLAEARAWRERDISHFLRLLPNYPKIRSDKVVLAGWSAGAGIALPFISNPQKLKLPEGVNIVAAILTYPYTAGCYETIDSFIVPVSINYGALDGNEGNPLTGHFCWKKKIEKLSETGITPQFNQFDGAYHGYDLMFLQHRKKRCRQRTYQDGVGIVCMAFNEEAMEKTKLINKRFLNEHLKN